MTDTLVDLSLRKLFCEEPPFAKCEFIAFQYFLDVGKLARLQEVSLGDYTCASLSSATILDEAERCRRLHILICSTSKEDQALFIFEIGADQILDHVHQCRVLDVFDDVDRTG